MNRFLPIHQATDDKSPNWGLMLFVDYRYRISDSPAQFTYQSSEFAKLANRFQIWQLERNNQKSYLALGHFPFGGDESVVDPQQLSPAGRGYGDYINQLIHQYQDENFTVFADFNFNPYLLGKRSDRVLDKIPHHNSIILDEKSDDRSTRTVTVDGILLSRRAKQQYVECRNYHLNLFQKLKKEYELSEDQIWRLSLPK